MGSEKKWVAVALEGRSKVPAVFGAKEEEQVMKYEVDDSKIYRMHVVPFTKETLNIAIKNGEIVAVAVNDITPEYEEILRDLNVEVLKGFSGGCKAVIEQAFLNK